MKNINKKSTLLSGFCLIMLTVLFSVSEAHAGYTWQVDKTFSVAPCNGDSRVCTSLKAAVAAAASGDKITISGGRYDGEYDILIENKNLQIVGAGQPRFVDLGPPLYGSDVSYTNGTAIYALNSIVCPTCSKYTDLGRVFHIKNSTVSISNMWIGGGNSGNGGAVLIEGSGSKVTFRNIKITGDTVGGASGGAIYNDGGTLSINSSYITGSAGSFDHQNVNRDAGSGGGLYNKGGKVMIADSVFQSCFIWRGGDGNMPGTTPNRRGFSAGNGGAIYNDAAGEIIIVRSDFLNNEAGEGGFGGNGSGLNVGEGYAGAPGGTGGAIHNEGSMYITDTSILGNVSGHGGAGGFSTTNPAVGAGGGLGGGIFNNGSLNLVNSTVSSNRAGNGGRGGSSDTANGDNGGPGGWGGGIYNAKTMEMTNVTVSANTPGGGGEGGLGGYISNGASGSGGDGGGVVNGATTRIDFTGFTPIFTTIHADTSAKNTIIAGNTGGTYPDVAGKFNSGGYNLIGVPYDDSNFRNDGDQKGSSAAPLNAKLGPLQHNGGRSATHDLLPGSPAIDAGDDSVTGLPWELVYDQRGAGFTRKYGSHVDIGAIETFPPNTAPTASAQTVSAIEDIKKTITLSASDAEADSLTYTITNPSNGTLSGTAPNLTYTPNANYNGSDSFTFKVNDGEFDSNVAKVTITVAAVNDVPTFTKGADPTVLEDAGAQTISGFLSNISVGPADESAQLLSFSVTSNTNFLLFASAPVIDREGNLIFTAKPDANGSTTISFHAQDSGTTSNGGVNTSATQTFVINITPVNDAPSFTKGANQTVNEDAVAQSIANWATAISKGPANESGQTIGFEVSNDNNGLFSAQPTVSSTGVLTYTPAANASGTATVSLRVKDSGGTADGGIDASATQTFTITINSVNDAPLASNNNATQGLQYSDTVQTVNISGTDVDSQSLTASVSFTKDGGSSQTGLPTGITLSSPANCTASTVQLIGAGTSCGWTVSGRAMVAPGMYVVTVTVNDGALSNSTSFTITVDREDARATYTGALFAATSTVSSGTATVTLAATIQDISALLGNPDTLPGDVRNATVKFVNRDNGSTLCAATGVGLVNANDLTVGTATCNWTTSIGTADSQSFTVGIVVEGFYTRNDAADNTVITVSKPIPGVIAGGGYLLLTNSGGQRAGDAGTKNNFGFNIKNDRNGPKGNINVIVRRMESDGILHVYQIKGNAMISLSSDLKITQNHPFPTAVFNGKANIQDITFANDPQNPRVISVDGGASLQVVMTDRGEPGSNDSIAITLWDKNGGLWFASMWNGVKTVEQTLGGGNLQVR